jgi:hypothetical protein
MKRTPENICLLCESEYSTKTNSHWIPAAMLKSMVGKRNNEESYQFSSFQKRKLDVYYGRENLKNTDPTIKQNHYALDYIFCPNCEDKLGVLEGSVIPIIQDEIRLKNKEPNYEEIFSEKGITFKKCLRLDNKLYRLFIYSIIWRFALVHRLEDNIILLTDETEEKLRAILNENLSLDLNEIINEKEIPDLPFQVFTADSFEDTTEGTVYSEDIHKEPMLCLANEFIILFYENDYSVTGNYRLPINKMVEADNVLNAVNDHPKIGFISNAFFSQLINQIFSDGAKATLNSLTNKVAMCTGLTNIESRFHLLNLGMDIHQKTGKNIVQAFEEAAELICNGQ